MTSTDTDIICPKCKKENVIVDLHDTIEYSCGDCNWSKTFRFFPYSKFSQFFIDRWRKKHSNKRIGEMNENTD